MARLQFEPSVVDVVGEGVSDAALYGWYVRSISAGAHAISPVDDFEIELNVDEYGDSGGNRERVIELAKVVEEALGEEHAPIVCVADSDLELLVPSNSQLRHLTLTHGPSRETLYLDPDVIDRFQSLHLRRRLGNPADVIEGLRPALETLYVLRAAKLKLAIRKPMPSIERSLVSGLGLPISLDSSDYVKRMIGCNQLNDEAMKLLDTAESFRGTLPSSPVPIAHGHDLLSIVAFACRDLVKDQKLLSEDVLDRSLMMALDIQKLRSVEPFKTIDDMIRAADEWRSRY